MNVVIIASIIGAVATVLAAVVAAFAVLRRGQHTTQEKIQGVTISIDGRMQELLDTTRALANAQGHAQGKEEARIEQRDEKKI